MNDREPTCTYRLQLRPSFGFSHAARVSSYLRRLGISHLYLSPILQAVPDSEHGYDVVDPTRVRAEFGGEEGFTRLCQVLSGLGMSQIIDVVPNHMAIGVPQNGWWWDVLENGPSSVFASYFDVDWDSTNDDNRIVLPVLSDHYGKLLDGGEIALVRGGGSFRVHHGSWGAPISPPTIAEVLVRASRNVASEQAAELAEIGEELNALPPSWSTEKTEVLTRHRLKERLRTRLQDLLEAEPALAAEVDSQVGQINADPDRLDAVLERQNYRLANWRSGETELGYRRFFDINTLIGVRMEDDMVFADSHARILEWLALDIIDGIRIDHVDGLADPLAYLNQLRQPGSYSWVVVEKILAEGELLPDTWPVAGTTGYEFASLVTRLMVDPKGESTFNELWASLIDDDRSFSQIAHEAKHEILRDALAPDLLRVAAKVTTAARSVRQWRDYSSAELREAVEEAVACLGVYRTYVETDSPAGAVDRARISAALEDAARRMPSIEEGAWRLISALWCGDSPFESQVGADARLRLQQLSSAVTAKAVEDTAFYRYLRLVALNEVGSDPARFAAEPVSFHIACSTRQSKYPTAMLTSSTHDTKRSEDIRARLVALSEVAEVWAEAVRRWCSSNAHYWAPGSNDGALEYLCYQTLVGLLPASPPSPEERSALLERLVSYMLKAAREAKLRTSWTDQNSDFEAALEGFIRSIVWDEAFMADICGLVGVVQEAGWVNSLSMLALKLMAPGVPDIYQGCEVWDYSLVDPDNRRPVAFELLEQLLEKVISQPAPTWWSDPKLLSAGAPKIGLTHAGLQLRSRKPECFSGNGSYHAVAVEGVAQDHVIAFSRGEDIVVIAVRLPIGLASSVAPERAKGYYSSHETLVSDMARAGSETMVRLAEGEFVDICTGKAHHGGAVSVQELLSALPVAILERRSTEEGQQSTT